MIAIPSDLQAVVFDVDGTLYRQSSVRRGMLLRLLKNVLLHPVSGLLAFRVIGAYRRAQEEIRLHNIVSENLYDAQISAAAKACRTSDRQVKQLVQRWMEEEPIQLIPQAIRPGLRDLLDLCKSKRIKLGVMSDYPAMEKLAALGVANHFDAIISAQDSEVGRFKPDPTGIRICLEKLDVLPTSAVYIGDRLEVDGVAANAAGTACILVGKGANHGTNTVNAVDFHEVSSLLFAPRDKPR